MPQGRRHLFFLFVALLLGGTAPILARAQPSPSCPAPALTPTPHRTRARATPTSTAHATATPVPGSSATPQPPPCPQPSNCGQNVKDCCPPRATTINKLVCGDARHPERDRRFDKHKHDVSSGWSAILLNILLVAFTGGLLAVGIGQWWLYRRQQDLTKNLERPWVLPTGEFAAKALEGNRRRLSLALRNFGRTPALQVTIVRIGRLVLEETAPLPTELPYGQDRHPDFIGTIPPNTSHGSHANIFAGFGTTLEEFELSGDLKAPNRLRLYVYGEVTYRPSLENPNRGEPPYFTEFCFYAYPGGDKFFAATSHNTVR